MRLHLILVLLLVAACDRDEGFVFPDGGDSMPSLKLVDERLAFACKYEVLPENDENSDKLFKYARWLQKKNLLQRDESVNQEIERLYRVAAENGHAKANINLQNGSIRRHFRLLGGEHLRLSQELIDSGVATGYYFVAIFLQQGSAGLDIDKDMAFRYFYKAAVEGNSQAQRYVGDKLAPIQIAPKTAARMRRCAAEQGDGEAAVAAAIRLKYQRSYEDAVQVLQMGVKAGNPSAASRLGKAFQGLLPTDEIYYIGQEEDTERADRYKKIWSILANYSYASPTVPEIDEIVPLPPAKLPPWDGKLQWVEEYLANIPPPKPDEWLIEKLAKAKGLDPKTGKPQPGSPAFRAEYFPAATCESNHPCPQEGYWKVMWPESWVQNDELIQHFNEGDLMPHPEGNYYIHRVWPLPRKLVKGPMQVKWGLLG
ncbi:MAG: DUF6396 domain-containing protein [Paucimonas sp.]|jgi:hypothetical protein|nr:DUF6396 domain-containing protein [Paucimonas sp.]